MPNESIVPDKEKLILDFGDTWFLQEYISRQSFYESIKNTLPEESDTVIALVLYDNRDADITKNYAEL